MITHFYTTDLQLSEKLDIVCVDNLDSLDETNAFFELDEQKLILHLMLDEKPNVLTIDLADGETAVRANKVSKSNEVIAKAIGCKPHYRPKVLDATAGMGRDALMMAMLGCNVIMQERNFAIFHLLNDALNHLKKHSEIPADITDQISLAYRDSIQVLNESHHFDVIYLDPMFPIRKKSALVRKEMRLFKLLTGDDLDSDQLLDTALRSEVKRIVVKRPKGAVTLTSKKPNHEIKSKNFRYDIYLR